MTFAAVIFGLMALTAAGALAMTPREPLHHLRYTPEQAQACRCIYCLTSLGDV